MGHREDLDKFRKKLEAAMSVIRKKSAMESIGQIAADQIKLRTRLGYAVYTNNGYRTKLHPLSKSYKLQRAGKLGFFTTKTGRVVAYKPEQSSFTDVTTGKKITFAPNENLSAKMSDQTSPGKSNLTRTGEMLDSMSSKFKSEGVVTVGPSGIRKDGLSNDIVAQYAHESGRYFNHLSNNEIAKLTQTVTKILNRLLKAFD